MNTATTADHRTPEWVEAFETGKATALAIAPGRSADIDTRRQQGQQIRALIAAVVSVEGAWPTTPFHHGLKVGLHNLLEENGTAAL